MQNPDSTSAREAQIEQHARHMVDKAFAESDRLEIQIFPESDAKLPPRVVVDWRIGREAGVLFTSDQRAEAVQWTIAILKSGWLFYRV